MGCTPDPFLSLTGFWGLGMKLYASKLCNFCVICIVSESGSIKHTEKNPGKYITYVYDYGNVEWREIRKWNFVPT